MKKTIPMFLVFVLGLAMQTAVASTDEFEFGELRAKSVRDSTVTIGSEVYDITPETEITDRKGEKIKLASIKVDDDPSKGPILFAKFVVSGDALESLQVLDLPQ